MTRTLLLAAVVALTAAPADAKRIARPFTPLEKVARAEVVVAGTVSAVEKETVNAVRFAGDAEKVAHKVAVIKVDKALVGGAGVTHLKVAFVPPPPADPNAPPVRGGRGGFQAVDLKPGQEGLFFLTRHPGGEYYTITPMMAPLDPKGENYKAQAEQASKAAAALADPLKALKAEKPADRFFAASALLAKYRSYPETGDEVESVKVPAAESKLILQAIAEADWAKADENGLGGLQAFYQLGLNPAAGFTQPKPAPGANFQDALKKAYTDWLAGPGKDYQVEKIVPKKK
jgi:hypothetical protein